MNHLKETIGNPYEVNGTKYQYIWAALPSDYNKSYPCYSFLQGFKNLETGKIESPIFGISVLPNGEYRSMNRPLRKEQVLSFDINWDIGIAREKE